VELTESEQENYNETKKAAFAKYLVLSNLVTKVLKQHWALVFCSLGA